MTPHQGAGAGQAIDVNLFMNIYFADVLMLYF